MTMLALGLKQLFALSNYLGIIQEILREHGIIRSCGFDRKPYGRRNQQTYDQQERATRRQQLPSFAFLRLPRPDQAYARRVLGSGCPNCTGPRGLPRQRDVEAPQRIDH